MQALCTQKLRWRSAAIWLRRRRCTSLAIGTCCARSRNIKCGCMLHLRTCRIQLYRTGHASCMHLACGCHLRVQSRHSTAITIRFVNRDQPAWNLSAGDANVGTAEVLTCPILHTLQTGYQTKDDEPTATPRDSTLSSVCTASALQQRHSPAHASSKQSTKALLRQRN